MQPEKPSDGRLNQVENNLKLEIAANEELKAQNAILKQGVESNL